MRDDTTVVTWVIKTFFFIVLLSISSWSLLLLLGLYHFCPFFGPSLDGMFLWYFQFSWRDFYSFPLSCYHLYLFSVHWKRPSLVSPCYSLKLHLVGCTFPFLPCFSLLFFSSAICKTSSDNHFAFSYFFSFGMFLFAACYAVLQTFVHSSSGTLFTRPNPLNLFVTATAYS